MAGIHKGPDTEVLCAPHAQWRKSNRKAELFFNKTQNVQSAPQNTHKKQKWSQSAVSRQAYRNPAHARTVPSPTVCAPSILFMRQRGMRTSARKGGLQPRVGSPGSFLLFVGFYTHLYFAHLRTSLIAVGAVIRVDQSSS